MEEKKTLKNYFDKIYVLNYIEGKGRRDAMIKQLEHFGILTDVDFSYGMPYSKIKAIKPKFQELANQKLSSFGKINGIGCSLNHYTVIKSAYELGYNRILVFEDDVCINNDIDLIYQYLDDVPKDWNYLYFTPVIRYSGLTTHDLDLFLGNKKWINLKEFITGNLHDNEYFNSNGFLSSGCYAMDRKAMELYIKIFENSSSICNSDLIEYFYHNISQSPLNSYTPNKCLFICGNQIDTLRFNKDKNKFEINQKYTNGGCSPYIDATDDKFSYYKLPNTEVSFI